MGLLESVVGGVVGQVLGSGRGASGAMSPLVKALLMLLLTKGASGGLGNVLGDVLGGGRPAPDPRSGGAGPHSRDPGHAASDDAGDIGGFNQGGLQDDAAPLPGNDYSDLSGMLDGPGDARPVPQTGNVSHETSGGLDGLVAGFHRSGLGDVVESWIGHGPNRVVAPDQLASALGPGTLDTLQSQTGLSRDDLLGQLSKVLPEVVHTLTPQGRVPDDSERHGW
ncbi:YidB family protein [uncultured Methylobacterium sp.]|uniref:YidB family protein n=1 Tax=uncultured Methylobacterium sp. TaxID=157278 RepID=UPI0035CB14E9